MKIKKSNMDYKWVILVACFLMEFISLGFCSSNPGLFTVPVTKALNIDRLMYSYHGSIRYATQVLVALSFGTLVNRFGIKKMVFVGLASMITATVLRMTATSVYHFYLASAFHGLGIVFVGGTMAGTIVRRWFKEDIGKYTGLVMSANGVGGAIAAQIISPIINNGETFGYRKAYFLMAAINVGISILILSLLRDKPGEGPVVAGKQKKAPQKGTLWTGLEYSTVKKRSYFYFTAALIFLTGISIQSIGGITIVYMTDLGISPAYIAVLSTVGSLVLTCSKFSVGAVYDKWGLRTALLMCLFSALTTFVLKGLLQNSTLGLVMAMTATVLSSIAAPLETVMLSLITNDLFGSTSYAKVLGIFMSMNSLGLCLGTPLGELLRRLTGSYRVCFWLFSAMLVVIIITYQFVLRAAYKEKNAILAAENV